MKRSEVVFTKRVNGATQVLKRRWAATVQYETFKRICTRGVSRRKEKRKGKRG